MALSERFPPGAGRLAARLLLGSLRRPRRRLGLTERLGMLPTRGLPLHAPVRIRWNDRHVPTIEAQHDTDLAVALGAVHAHLRLAQIEFMRRAAWGRLADGAQLGSCARYISDFADPDANWFALLGGQDGWLGSDGFLDQMALWRDGRYVQVPMRAETARAMFVHVVELAP